MGKTHVVNFARRFVEVLPQVMRGVLRWQNDALTKGKVTAPQFLVLDLIYTHGPLKMSELSQEIKISLPAMTGLVARLYKMKMVQRISGEKDRRIIRINLTSTGENTVKAFRQQREKIFSEIFSRFSDQERKDFLGLLVKMKDIILSKKRQ
ncbi:MAG: MarR family transcriptional regulator [Candidatus Omnitrophota bacterium]